MKIKYFLVLSLCTFLGIFSCTDSFEEINTNPNAVGIDEASARYFVTGPQVDLFAPNRFPYWRAHLIHADRYAGHVTFGHSGSWWSDGLGYDYNPGYTDAAWGWQSGYFSSINNYLNLTGPGGEFENELMHAAGKIMKGMYYQNYTDTYGDIPYSEAGVEGIDLPKFDPQRDIYQGVIQELNSAMATIGENERTGPGVSDLGDNDLYFGGDLQKWKKLANGIKLRMAMRALGAPGADFATSAINEALAAPLPETADDNALLTKDTEISQWASAAYGDIWFNFGIGSDWMMSKPMIDQLQQTNDPRLQVYAQPSIGGTIFLAQPDNDDIWAERLAFILGSLDEAGAEYTKSNVDGGVEITMAENTYYVGQPVRLRREMHDLAAYEFWSRPAQWVIQAKGQGQPIFPEIVYTSAEAYFLRADAANRGMGSGDANAMYQEGIRQAMKLWEVGDADIDAFLATEEGQLSGSMDDNDRKINTQRWLAAFTDGFEAWAVVRKSGYPESLANGVSNFDYFASGTIEGAYPTRLRYGNGVYANNETNLQEALNRQGPDMQDTKLWWETK